MPTLAEKRREQMFPRLTDAQIARIAALGQRRPVPAGEVLFEQGQQNTPFILVTAGTLAVVRPGASAIDDLPIVVHQPGEFTGELNMLSGRRSQVRGRMQQDGEIIALDREAFRGLVHRDAELSEIFMRAFILRRMGLIEGHAGDTVLIGSRHSAATLRLKEFLTRNSHPFAYLDVETDPDVQTFLDRFHVGAKDVPVVICQDRKALRNPSVETLAQCLGLSLNIDPATIRDVVVVGGGPAGLACAVYAASEGLDVLVLEGNAPGGQAGSSSRIENYLGFPTGISGQALAGRAFVQAEKFGAEIAIARAAVALDCMTSPYQVSLASGEIVRTKCVVIASGAEYRRPELPNRDKFEGTCIHYGATFVEAQICVGEEVIVVGGGNSAGQAAVYLSDIARKVHMLVRGPGLADTMSKYLIERINDNPRIDLHTRTVIEEMQGTDVAGDAGGAPSADLQTVRWRNLETGVVSEHPVRHIFFMAGATSNTRWLNGCVTLDSAGFVKTGTDLRPAELQDARWALPRPPRLLETSLPGVFAVGDVRSGSVKRVASAVGEGSICVQLIHQTLQELWPASPPIQRIGRVAAGPDRAGVVSDRAGSTSALAGATSE
jgi:thioredoxin reductase (NADPH)